MALYFGLNINRSFTDIPEANTALLNLGLDIRDLDRIRGISTEGVTETDLRTLSSLTFDFEKEAAALSNETSIYVDLTTNAYDENTIITNNLTINGQLGASAIKYNFVNFDNNNAITSADISTSRVSSWSTFESGASAPIFYGGEVQMQSYLELSTLEINDVVAQKRFDSEIPTHRIKVRINGEDIWMYAMKGIPLTFTCFFRSCDLTVSITPLNDENGNVIKPSWVIKNTDATAREYPFKNILASNNNSNIFLSDTGAKERDVQFYYPTDKITALYFSSVGLVELPKVVLTALTTLSIPYNNFREFPDLTKYTSLTYVDISQQDLTRAVNPDPVKGLSGTIGSVSNNSATYTFTATITGLQAADTAKLSLGMTLTESGTNAGDLGTAAYITSISSTSITIKAASLITGGAIVFDAQLLLNSFSPAIAARFPPNLETIYLGNCHSGNSTADLSAKNKLLNLYLNGWPRRLTGTTPAVYKDYAGAGAGDKLATFYINSAYYSTVHPTVMDLKSLTYIDLSWNVITNDVYISSEKISTFVGWGNYFPPVNLSNRKSLVEYYAGYSGWRRTGSLETDARGYVQNFFDGCSALQTVYMYSMDVYGPVPTFTNCTSLRYVNFDGTNLRQANDGYVLSSTQFDSCRNTLQYFILSSGELRTQSLPPGSGNPETPAVFSDNCFKNMPALYYVQITSYRRGISGGIPNFSSAKNITYILMYNNRLTGNIPSFDGNNSLFYVHFVGNLLEGSVPNIKSPNIQHLLLSDNKLSTFYKLDSVSLRRLHLDYNAITMIPDMSNLIYLQEFLMNNQSVSSVSYTKGSFTGLISIRTINLANNGINETDINDILRDLLDNYKASPRGGVYVNLTGNSAPSSSDEMSTVLKNLASIGWTVQTA